MPYVALLRGINVGGSNVIRMSDVRTCLTACGLAEVATYIQSGNVLFNAESRDAKHLRDVVEQGLSTRFAYQARAVILSHRELQHVVDGAPRGFGKDPSAYRYDVIFLMHPLTAREAMKSVTLKEGVDTVGTGRRVLYFSRLISKATQSRLGKLVITPAYQQMTIRNWNTTVKLLALADARLAALRGR